MNKRFKAMLFSGAVLFLSVQPVLAQQTERVPALREKVYSQLARAQTIADEQNNAAGIAVLKEVEARADSMNSYERAMLWNFYGFMHYDMGNTQQAIQYFSKVVDETPIPASLKKSTLFSLSQLALSNSQYDDALAYLNHWKSLAKADEMSKAWVLEAQAHYQKSDYKKALASVQKALQAADQAGEIPKENWLILVRAIHYELGQTEGVARALEQLVVNYSKPEYWLQLGGIYGQLEQNKKQLAVLEAAYQQGFIKDATDIRQLAQVYYLNDLPYEAAKLMRTSFTDGTLKRNLSNQKFYAQSLMQAKEYAAAIEAYREAASLGERADMLAQAAQLAINTDRNALALQLAEAALAAGGLSEPGNMYLVQGMAHVNDKNYAQAIAAFSRAADFNATKKAASQWASYAKSQQRYQQQLANIGV